MFPQDEDIREVDVKEQPFMVVPIDPGIAEYVREHDQDPQYGYPATRQAATGYGPCRVCLSTFVVGRDRRILFTYNPFDGIEPYPQPGPVFIHENACEPYADADVFPPELRAMPMTLEAYAHGPELVSFVRIDDEPVEAALARLLSDPAVDYVHVRNTEAGCFDLRVERGSVC